MSNSFIKALEHSSLAYFIRINLQGNYVFVNDLYKQHFGHLYTNFIGDNPQKTVHAEDVEKMKQAGWQVVSNPNKVVEIDLRKPTLCGEVIYVRWNLFAIQDNEGMVTEVGGIGINITEHLQEKNNHKHTQQKLQAILQSSDESFYFLDKDMKVLSFNIGATNATSLFYNQTMKEGYDFSKSLLPGTEEHFYAQFNNALLGKETSTENEMVFPTGINVWYKLTMKPVFDEDKNIMGVALSFINIDSLKKTEHKLKEIAWQQSHAVRKPVSNILGLIELLKIEQDQEKQKELLTLLEKCTQDLDAVIKEVVAKTGL